MTRAPAASVIVAFYEDAPSLGVVLAALADQSVGDFEVLVADDGSGPATRAAVTRWIAASPLEVRHLWQPDAGFRKTRALDAAALEARGGRLLVTDGDCVPQHHWVADHLEQGSPGVVLSGRRACLSPRCSELLRRAERPARFTREHGGAMLVDYLRLRGRNIEKGLRIASPSLRRLLRPRRRRRPRPLTGCNLSLTRDDLFAVNGWDTRYQAPGCGEDSDLDWRLAAAGMQRRELVHAGIVLHLDHPLQPRSEANRALARRLRAEGRARTTHGLAELATELAAGHVGAEPQPGEPPDAAGRAWRGDPPAGASPGAH